MTFKAALYGWTATTLRTLDHHGVRLRYPYRDRIMFENHILPAIAGDDSIRRVLMVGCGWYTHHYPSLLGDTEVTTIDLDAAKRPFGGDSHIVGNLTMLGDHIPDEGLDAVLCNGVLGWGLNELADVEQAFTACIDCLRPGGLLLLGWNDHPPYNRVSPEDIPAFAQLEPVRVPGLDAHRVVALPRNQHCFQAFRKPFSD
ncbi:methyltransferase domain-containing protein [Kushneria marisflavi]|uniref:Methyltransferase type 11 n=1 Tax=Kushneria marisflavi TaxID=157779 RepID=A0A240UQU4_9GAMM|nr:class I SAM-dependent methyltransferase [Kushneria marisflavi]ART63848.1 methyltransferase type 11 [Kushneria marisflavi]RKD85553.1 methyltransferase family protein [Kushneria marisflavi]